MGWKDEELEDAKKLWLQGLSATQIAREINKTHGGSKSRNAVLGKVHRLKLTNRETPSAPTIRARAVKAVSAKPRVLRSVAAAPPPVVLPGHKQCKWPIGDPGQVGFHFCSSQNIIRPDGRESPYCEEHTDLAYVRSGLSSSGAQLTRALRRFI